MELAANVFDSTCNSKNIRLALMPVMDYIFAFWGSIDDKLANGEAGIIIKCGKFVERLDLYLRFSCEQKLIDGEYEKLSEIISRVPADFCNAAHLTEWLRYSP
jgi:hypothetical protein